MRASNVITGRKPKLGGRQLAERRCAVQHDARTHPADCELRVAQQCRRVGERHRQRLRARRRSERVELPCHAFVIVRTSEVRHQRHVADVGRIAQALQHPGQAAQASSPRRFMPVLSLTNTSIGAGRRACINTSTCSAWCSTAVRRCWQNRRELARLEEAFQQQDWTVVPGLAQAQRRSMSRTAKPSADANAAATRSMPCPYALALMTASTRACGACDRATARLLRNADRLTMARIGRGMVSVSRHSKARTAPGTCVGAAGRGAWRFHGIKSPLRHCSADAWRRAARHQPPNAR